MKNEACQSRPPLRAYGTRPSICAHIHPQSQPGLETLSVIFGENDDTSTYDYRRSSAHRKSIWHCACDPAWAQHRHHPCPKNYSQLERSQPLARSISSINQSPPQAISANGIGSAYRIKRPLVRLPRFLAFLSSMSLLLQ